MRPRTPRAGRSSHRRRRRRLSARGSLFLAASARALRVEATRRGGTSSRAGGRLRLPSARRLRASPRPRYEPRSCCPRRTPGWPRCRVGGRRPRGRPWLVVASVASSAVARASRRRWRCSCCALFSRRSAVQPPRAAPGRRPERHLAAERARSASRAPAPLRQARLQALLLRLGGAGGSLRNATLARGGGSGWCRSFFPNRRTHAPT